MGSVLADAATTHYKLGHGCIEGNPLYGDDLGRDKILAINVLLAAGLWWAGDELDAKNGPTWPLWLVGALRMGVATHNAFQDCEQ